ncbi:MAG TPA: hypothetical protein VFC58_00980 [Desulfosporosinus sp.]|nr:hypothetical protein [Desulfosporosinus sp.]
MAKNHYPLRLDPKLYVLLERWAADEFRSVNAHMEFLLREAVQQAGRLNGHEQGSSADSEEATD